MLQILKIYPVIVIYPSTKLYLFDEVNISLNSFDFVIACRGGGGEEGNAI